MVSVPLPNGAQAALAFGITRGGANSFPVLVDSQGGLIVQTEGSRPTFNFSTPAGGQVLAATPTDVLEITGAAIGKVRITRLRVSLVTATAQQNLEVLAIRRSTLHAGGTVATIAAVSSDIVLDGTVQGAVINLFSVNGTTLGTSLGAIADIIVPAVLPAGIDPVVIDLIGGDDSSAAKPIVLNGTADTLCLNLNGATLTHTTTIYVDGAITYETPTV
jgi:hypothetical protein